MTRPLDQEAERAAQQCGERFMEERYQATARDQPVQSISELACYKHGFLAGISFQSNRESESEKTLREALEQIIANAPDQSNPENFNKYAYIAQKALDSVRVGKQP